MSVADIFLWNPLRWWWVPLAAVVLDILFGDPRRLWHPVQGIGRLLVWAEPWVLGRVWKKTAGGLAVAGVVTAAGLTVGASMGFPLYLGVLFAVYWSWTGLALGSLLRAGSDTLAIIKNGSLQEAREAVGMLVSRDVGHLEREGLYKTLAETLSENMNDGIIAPFFWLMVGGPMALWAYKAVSTMDSTWGYKNDRWRDAGFACAKLDDILAFIPARLSAFFLFAEARFGRLARRPAAGSGRNGWPGWKVIAEQAGRMESPNAGWPMAVAAWAESAPMGGTAVYDGKTKVKPVLGPEEGEWDERRLVRLIRHIGVSSLGGMLFLWGIVMAAAYFFCPG